MTDKHVAEGLAALAVTLAEMGTTEERALREILAWMYRLGTPDAETARAAAEAVATMAQPLDAPLDRTEAARQIRQMLGVSSVTDQLTAALQGREWLEEIARALEAPEGD